MNRTKVAARPARNGQSLVEFALILPILLMLMIGGLVYNDVTYRIERIQFASGLAARAAALTYENSSGTGRQAAALAAAQDVLNPLFSPSAVNVAPINVPSPCYGQPVTVTVSVQWTIVSIPFFGSRTYTLAGTRQMLCSH